MRIYEDAAVQPAVYSSDTSLNNNNNNNNNSNDNSSDIEEKLQQDRQKKALIGDKTVTFGADDVDYMQDDEIMNYVYFNQPKDIDENTRQKLYKRADDIRKKQQNGTMTPQQQTDFVKGVIAAASTTKAQKLNGESFNFRRRFR